MPLNGGGTASKPPGTTAVPNTTIASAPFNSVIDDIYAIFNTPRPIVYGGTNGASAVEGIDNLSTKGTDIPSATTTDIGAATGRFVHITGTTTITGLGTKAAGVVRNVVFDGVLTLTYNATSLILPGGSSIQTAAGDCAIFVSEGAGNWRCTNYVRASDAFTTIASAATTDLSTVSSANVTVTGTTTITSFGPVAAGIFRRVVFAGSLTLTHNATSLILPQGANVATQTGDSLEAVSLGSGNWRVTSYQKVGSPITSATSQATTSGTTFDFLSIPPGVKLITVMFDQVSLSGTDDILVQGGTSVGFETSGYTSGSAGSSTSNSGYIVRASNAARAPTGQMILTNISGNSWVSTHVIHGDTSTDIVGGGRKIFSGTLDRIRITRTGTDTFDLGSVNIMYQ